MGLAERRVVLDFETNALPALKTRIEEAAGAAVPVEIQWDGLCPNGESHLFIECWSAIYFEPLIAALKTVGRDAMGKEALKAGLKKIVVQNTKGNYYADGLAALENGSLTLDHEPLTNAGDVDARTAALVNVLEAGL